MSRVLLLLLLLPLLLCLGVVNAGPAITIYTKPFEPFSNAAGEGFTIDFVNIVLRDIYGVDYDADITVLENNNQIFDAVLVHNHTAENFSIGAAAITINADRLNKVNFLHAYFRSGQQLLVRVTNTFSEIASKVARNLTIAIFSLAGVIIFLVSVFGPLVWFAEFRFNDDVPIFIDWTQRLENARATMIIWGMTISPKVKMMLWDVWIALQWTFYTLTGTSTGYPNSVYARGIHSILKVLYKLLIVISIGVFTNVFRVSTDTTNINGYQDLRGSVVCTVQGSTSESYLTANNIGFAIRATPSIDDMFADFWADKCNAVLYDFPALQSAIVERQNTHGEVDAVIVGDILQEEYYGLAVHPLLDSATLGLLQQHVVALTTDHARYDALVAKWFAKIENAQGRKNVGVPTALIVVPCVLGFGLLILAVAWLYRNYDAKTEHYRKLNAQRQDNDYADDLLELLKEEGSNKTMLWNLDRVLDDVREKVLRTLRVIYEETLRAYYKRRAAGNLSDEVDILEEPYLPPPKQQFVLDTTTNQITLEETKGSSDSDTGNNNNNNNTRHHIHSATDIEMGHLGDADDDTGAKNFTTPNNDGQEEL